MNRYIKKDTSEFSAKSEPVIKLFIFIKKIDPIPDKNFWKKYKTLHLVVF